MERVEDRSVDLRQVVEAYLQAATERDLDRCLALYAEDAVLFFGAGVFRGRKAITEWHRERFAAEVQFVRIEAIRVQGETVIVDGVVTSRRLRAWRIGTLGGRATFRFREGRITEARFGVRLGNPLEGW